MSRQPSKSSLRPMLELTVCLLIFAGAAWWSQAELPLLGVAVATLLRAGGVSWGLQWTGGIVAATWLHSVCLGTGILLLAELVIFYTRLSERMSLEVLVVADVLCCVTVLSLRAWTEQDSDVVLFVGEGPLRAPLAAALGPRLIGVVGPVGPLPSGAKHLGTYADLSAVWEQHSPAHVVFDVPDWTNIQGQRELLERKIRGVCMERGAATYERLMGRVSLNSRKSSEILWSEMVRTNRRMMALQAVYSNLSGLLLLVVLFPVMLVIAAIARIEAGSGPLFEQVECEGFQGIPFKLFRFRLYRAATGRLTFTGRILRALDLIKMPQLINVVRGEMALFGPEPVQRVFADYLDSLSPLYYWRRSIKPGVFGWARTWRAPGDAGKMGLCEEHLVLSYDIFYIENGSPLMDIEILVRNFLKRPVLHPGPYVG